MPMSAAWLLLLVVQPWPFLGQAPERLPLSLASQASGTSRTAPPGVASPSTEARAPAAPSLKEGDLCVLALPLLLTGDVGRLPQTIPAGDEVRIVRPQLELTDLLVHGQLVSAATSSINKACQEVAQKDAPAALPAHLALRSAEERFTELRFAEVLPLLRGVLSDDDISVEDRKRAYLLQGSSLAVMGYTIEAESFFRSLLHVDAGFRLPRDTSPKISSVFERVAREVEALRRDEAAVRRAEMLQELRIGMLPLQGSRGGEPLRFDVGIRDPRGVVEDARAFYRRRGEPSYASIALHRQDTGRWHAELPAAYTVSQQGFMIEVYLATFDAEGGTLVQSGSSEKPTQVKIAAGALPEDPVYQSPWFWGVLGSAGVVGVVATGAIAGLSAYLVVLPYLSAPVLPVD